ncbi:MAG TPA: hypothetical protein VFT99_19320, partial [Roseiflexaceae bacterium]|nr:hypothetical protein [Roseiflexaceae bacterium]
KRGANTGIELFVRTARQWLELINRRDGCVQARDQFQEIRDMAGGSELNPDRCKKLQNDYLVIRALAGRQKLRHGYSPGSEEVIPGCFCVVELVGPLDKNRSFALVVVDVGVPKGENAGIAALV